MEKLRGDSEIVMLESDNEEPVPIATQRGRKKIRHIKEGEDLKLDTRLANEYEKERIIRIEKREAKFKEVERYFHEKELILDYDFINQTPLVSVHESLVQKMKNHQIKGVKFMWNACYESLEQVKQSNGSGCIIAHCMGLGKTFQVIALVHTVLSHPATQTKTVLVCCPKNTLMNWMNEFEKWITQDLGAINMYNPTRFGCDSDRLREITKWHGNGGVCIINYELVRILLEDDGDEPTSMKSDFHKHLCDPGPDLVVCDEGHVLKNEETKLWKAMNWMRTKRRIVLTGTPLQNNLKEYHCMIQFVKPNLLGTRTEFTNMFVNPILNGQYENSSLEDVQLMKERSHVLYKMLLGCVQRFDLTTLRGYLPEKKEYVVSILLTETQVQMYRFYLDNHSAKGDPNWKNDGVALFADYQALQRVWTHPYTLKDHADRCRESSLAEGKKSKKKKRTQGVHERESEDESTDPEAYPEARVPLFWWLRFATVDDVEDARQSNKLTVLLKVVQACEEAGEKLLVFSGSLYSLRLIRYFLGKINESETEDPSLCHVTSCWEEEVDFAVLTGRTSSEDRDRYCRSFNDPLNSRFRLFLISTKAGGVGINLTGACRAVLFDVSWNPSHDVQSVFRIYRIGQKRPCFVYRFVASGTMEEKIYERQVAKQSISHRVVDEKQIARHYTQRELLELYLFEPKKEKKMAEVEDPLLRRIFRGGSELIGGIHEHDSLLEHKTEEELQELEKNDAWIAYNQDDEIKNLPPEEVEMLSRLTPESFDPVFLRKVLEEEYSDATSEEISLMMEALMPRINAILESPDFIDTMKRQALLLHASRRPPRPKREKKKKVSRRRTGFQEKENAKSTAEPRPGTSWKGSSDSEDSNFLREIGTKRRKTKGRPKPLKVWGARNGRAFGSPPDSDS